MGRLLRSPLHAPWPPHTPGRSPTRAPPSPHFTRPPTPRLRRLAQSTFSHTTCSPTLRCSPLPASRTMFPPAGRPSPTRPASSGCSLKSPSRPAARRRRGAAAA
eukprot:scaffold3740_cov108-Isochrysis_galbana.AAC.3